MAEPRGYISGASGIVAVKYDERGSKTVLPSSELIPGDLCPHLAHSLAPYVLTFEGGGYFPWMRADDIVDVQCPNPQGAVVARLKINNRDFDVEIKNVRGECVRGHKAGDISVWKAQRNIFASDLNLLLAWLIRMLGNRAPANSPPLYSTGNKYSYRLERATGECSAVAATPCPPQSDFEMNLKYFTHRCRYHKFPRRENYSRANWIPGGFCAELFHTVYPTCLALVYGATGIPDMIVCPHGGRVRVKIEVADRVGAGLRKLAMAGLLKAGINTEIPTKRCYLRIAEAAADCPMKMSAGAIFEFNMGELNQLCPAMFHNAYPTVVNAMAGFPIPWTPLQSGGIVQCPDEASNITMNFSARKDNA